MESTKLNKFLTGDLEQLLTSEVETAEDLKSMEERIDYLVSVSGNAIDFNPEKAEDIALTVKDLKELHSELRIIHKAIQGIYSTINENSELLDKMVLLVSNSRISESDPAPATLQHR